MKKIFISIIICFTLIIQTSNCFASNFEFKAFVSRDWGGDASSRNAASYMVNIYQKLGYRNSNGSGFVNYASKGDVTNYLNYLGNNFGMYICAHGGPDCIAMVNGVGSEYIYPNEMRGYWHLVFIDACSCLKTTVFADALKTTGYAKRACIGWYDTVTNVASEEFMKHFYVTAGKSNLRQSLLDAAQLCENYTPIRIYGDKSWNGYAF